MNLQQNNSQSTHIGLNCHRSYIRRPLEETRQSSAFLFSSDSRRRRRHRSLHISNLLSSSFSRAVHGFIRGQAIIWLRRKGFVISFSPKIKRPIYIWRHPFSYILFVMVKLMAAHSTERVGIIYKATETRKRSSQCYGRFRSRYIIKQRWIYQQFLH